jgi:CheY-like chemotaxis protein
MLWVRDDGAGIAPELLDDLFLPFVQAPQALDRTRGGLGLGLAMVKGLVELHGGKVVAHSEGLGKGSVFTVRLPLVAGPVATVVEAPKAKSGPRRVLVIEDNIDSADLLRDLLKLLGHEAEVAYDGPAGIELARTFRPHIVLCDVGLPGMTGYEVASAMRADPQLGALCLVALTGYARPQDQKDAMAAGFDRHVAKPLSIEAIEQVVG